MPKWINTFNSGLHSDYDPSEQPPDTYRESLNGHVFFNPDGSLAWQPTLGNSVIITIAGNYHTPFSGVYTPIGFAEFPDKIVIQSVSDNGINSEIGLGFINPDGTGSYITIFNDLYDPNGDLLKFSLAHDMTSNIANVENEKIQRNYFSDNFNEGRSFNVVLGLQSVSPEFVNGDYNPLAATGKYPEFYSVHSMSDTPDLLLGKIKYVQNIGGNLNSGVYQYSYRLKTKDGYATPFVTPTRHIFLTSDPINTTNSQEYAMQASQLATSKGIQISVSGIDTRFETMEVCAVYSITPTASLSATIFSTIAIDGNSTITVNHIDNKGTPIDLSLLGTQFTSVTQYRVGSVREKRRYIGNIKAIAPVIIDTSGITMKPYMKSMQADENPIDYDPVNDPKSPPWVNTKAYSTTTTLEIYKDGALNPVYDTYQILNDYLDYKGTQVEHIYPGYFRGEWYRIGVLFYDKKGNPMFVNFIGDIQFPQQYNNTYTIKSLDANGNVVQNSHTTGSVGDFVLTDNGADSIDRVDQIDAASTVRTKIIGLKVGNIDLTDIIDEIGGFAIVRCERDPTILAQGLLMNCVNEIVGGDTLVTRPMGYAGNHFDGATTLWWMNNSNINPVCGKNKKQYAHRPYTFTYECPDYLMDATVIPALQTNYKIQTVAGCYFPPQYGNDLNYGVEDYGQDAANTNLARAGIFSKTIYTSLTGFKDGSSDGTINPWPQTSGLDFYTQIGMDSHQAGYDPSIPGASLDGYVHVRDDGTGIHPIYPLTNDRTYDGWYHDGGLVFKASTFVDAALVRTDNSSQVCYLQTNFIIDGKVPYGGVDANSLSESIYISTGHFQPINDAVKAQVARTVAGQTKYIFDDVEVWGGDCYNQLYEMARVYSANVIDSATHNIAIGNVFPCEMKYNATLRKGNTWVRHGFKAPDFYALGVTKDNPEDNLLNSVLSYSETNVLFNGKPVDYVFNTDFSLRWLYSNQKIYGELIDTFRQFPVNQFDDLDGRYGQITGATYLFDNIYSWQQRAFGRLRVLDRVPLQDPATGGLKIGVGGILDSIEYISTVFGTNHTLSLANTGKAAYWVDIINKVVCRFAQNGFEAISDVKGLHNEIFSLLSSTTFNFTADNPSLAGGIHSVVDRENREVLFTFISAPGTPQTTPTLGFSELNEAFTGHYSFQPTKYLTFGSVLMSYNDTFLWKHNDPTQLYANYYTISYQSKLTFCVVVSVVSQKRIMVDHDTKVWDVQVINGSSMLDSGVPILSLIQWETDLTTDSITPPTDSRFRYREGKNWLPVRGITTSYRERGEYLKTTLTINNADNIKARIKSIETEFRKSRK